MKKSSLLAFTVAGICGVSGMATADMDGIYISKDKCRLKVEQIAEDDGYADATFHLRSDGTGACEWTGVGVSKRTIIDAGIVSGSSRAFVEMNWVYGPMGNKIEVTFYDTDGTKRYTDSYEKEMQTAGN